LRDPSLNPLTTTIPQTGGPQQAGRGEFSALSSLSHSRRESLGGKDARLAIS